MGTLKKIIDSSTWVIFFLSVIFSLMTVVAQNSIPGDSLYGFKLGYEKVMLASSKFLNKQVDVQIEFVARRFSETTQVLSSQYGSESLNRLNDEVDSTAYTITMIEDPAEKKAAAKKYVAQLNVISSGLGRQKQNFVSSPNLAQAADQQTNTTTSSNTYYPTTAPTTSSSTGVETKATPTPTIPPTQNTQIVEEIDNTQQNIEEVIEEMENIAQEQEVAPLPTNTPAPTATPIPPTPTTVPTVAPTEPPTPTPTESMSEKIEDFCTKHPDKCNDKSNNNSAIEEEQ